MAMTPEEALALAEKEQQAVLDADMAAQEEKTNREMDDKLETDALAESQKAELDALGQYNQSQYNNVGDIISEIETKQAEAKQKDAQANKRSNAFRYIAGLGDTLSGMANLIGTAHGATNQKQTYNGNIVAEKAEQARKERKIELDSLSKRLDEMKARQRDMQAAGSLAEAQLKAKQDLAMLQLQQQQRAKAEEAKRYADSKADAALKDVRTQANWERTFNEQQRQFDAEQKRLKDQNDARLKAEKEMAEQKAAIELLKQQQQKTEDPKHQAEILSSKIVGVRDELASKMGYKDYNEYLRYKNVDGWGKDIDGQRNRESKRIRNQRSSENPETEEFLDMLSYPEELTEEQIRMLMGVSKVFSDAVGASTVTEEAPGVGAAAPTPKKEEPKSDEQGREKVDY